MSVEKQCPRCGQPLPDSLLGGSCPQCLARLVSALQLSNGERRRFGSYELLTEIGRGGMGVVYKARDVSLDRVVAIKMMLSAQFASGKDLERFHDEAKAIARFEHPNIVAIYEVGSHEGQPYFSMQWIDGCSLAARAPSRQSPLSNREAAELLAKVARAVHHAHQRGILHRDLKPANILLDARGEPHVSDFGLARSLTAARDVTLPGAVLGSPSFMAPEQAAGKTGQITTATDIYSLGGILYFLLTGQAPFSEATPLETLRCVQAQDPVKPSAIRTVDRDLETICLKCLRKEPQRRYASADALADDLGRWLCHEPIQARPVGTIDHIIMWAKRKPTVAASIGVAMLITALGFAAVLWQWRQAEEARRQAHQAHQEAVEELYSSYLAQARANRWSGRAGRRFDSLEALTKAAAIRPSLELRNEAIACLALPDVRVERRISGGSARIGSGLAFDIAFERYVSVSPEGTISIRKVSDNQELLSLAGPPNPVWVNVWFSPDGRYLAEKYLGKTNQVLVWDLFQRKVIMRRPVTARGCYRPDSKQWTAAEENGSIWSYDLGLGREVWRLRVPPVLQTISYDPTGKRLAVSRQQNPTVLIVNVATKEIEQRFDHPASIGMVAWSPDGTWLACPGSDGRTYMHHVETGSLGDVFEGHLGSVGGAIYNLEGDIVVTSGWDEMTRFWDPKLGKPLLSLPGGWVGTFFGSGDKLGFAVSEREAGVWQVEPARECRRLGRTGALSEAQFSPDGNLLAAAASDGIWIWRVEGNRLLAQLDATNCADVLFAPDGSSLISSGQSGVQLWPLQDSDKLSRSQVGAMRILFPPGAHDCCLGPGGRSLIVLPGDSHGVMVLDLQNLTPKSVGDHLVSGPITASPDGTWFATGNWRGTNVTVWEMATAEPVKELVVKGNAKVLFSPDGRWLATVSDEEYRLWKTGSWEPGLAIPRKPTSALFGRMAFSPDGRILAVLQGRNSQVRLVSVQTGNELATLETGPPLCFASNGTLLATAGEDLHSVFVWNLHQIRNRLAAMNLDW